MMNHYPRQLADYPVVTASVGQQFRLTFIPERESRFYRLLLPPQDRAWWGLSVTLESTTVRPPTDRRDLGFVLVEAGLSATDGFPVLSPQWQIAQFLRPGGLPLLPPWWQLAAFLLGSTATYGFFRGIGAARWLAWLFAAALVALVAWFLVERPMEIAPYTMRLAGLCGLGGLLGLATLRLREHHNTTSWLPFLKLLILMGIAYWLMPIYQLVMTADGVRYVAPYPPTLWIAGGGAALLAVGLTFLADSGRLHQWQRLVVVVLALAALARLFIMLEFVMDNSGVAVLTLGMGLLWVAASYRLPLWSIPITGLLTVAVVVLLASQFDPWQGRGGPDFWILFKGARNWFRGGSLYDLKAVHENHFGHVFKVPPFYGMLFLPFVQQDGLTILFWHRIINMLLLSAILLILLRSFAIRLVSPMGAALLLVFAMRAVADTVAFGQIDILLLLLLTLALVASRRGSDGLAGAAIALGTLFKLYPVLLLAFFLVKRQWRGFVGFAVAMLVCNGIALLVMGWEMHRVYLFEVIPNIGGGTSWVENQTLNGFLSRIFASDITSTIYEHPIVTMATYIGFGVAVVAAMLLSLRRAERTSARYAIQFALYVVLMVFVVPAAWMHYQTILILPFVAVLLSAWEGGGFPRWRAALVALAYGLIAYGNQWSFYLGDIMGGLTVFGVSFKFYGMLLLLTAMVACVVERGGRGDQGSGSGDGAEGVIPDPVDLV
jgi:alpha-1,2-mannosyltransferase